MAMKVTPHRTNFTTKVGCYEIGGIRYIAESHFLPPATPSTIKTRLKKIITGDLVDLPAAPLSDTMAAEYVCSAAGKED